VATHFRFKTTDGGMRSKLVLIQWIPSQSPAREKMGYAMWTNVVRTGLQGIHSVLQACNLADLDYNEVLQRISRFERDPVVGTE
jgi:hypothetical protein